MNQPELPVVKVGDVVRLEEPNYRYGTGPLLLRVAAVGQAHRDADGIWLELRGSRLHLDGQHVHGPERYALVRLAAVRLNPPLPENNVPRVGDRRVDRPQNAGPRGVRA